MVRSRRSLRGSPTTFAAADTRLQAGQAAARPSWRWRLLRRHQDPEDRVDDQLAARNYQQDQDEQDPGRPGREPKAAAQADAYPGDDPTLARSNQALTTEVLCHVPSASLHSLSIPTADPVSARTHESSWLHWGMEGGGGGPRVVRKIDVRACEGSRRGC